MKDRISALMDGELDDRSAAAGDRGAAAATREALDTWRTYHLISDAHARQPRCCRTASPRASRSGSPPSRRCSRRGAACQPESRRWFGASAAASFAAVGAGRLAGLRARSSAAGARGAASPQAGRRPRSSRTWCRCRAPPTTICSPTRASRRASRCRAWRPTCAPSPSTPAGAAQVMLRACALGLSALLCAGWRVQAQAPGDASAGCARSTTRPRSSPTAGTFVYQNGSRSETSRITRFVDAAATSRSSR